MSVLGSSKLRSSYRKLRFGGGGGGGQENGGGIGEEEQRAKDQGIFHQTFTHHWVACRDRIHNFEPDSDRNSDDILTVGAQLEQMLQLLQMELSCSSSSSHGPTSSILDMVLSDKDNILAQIVAWTRKLPHTQSDPLILLEVQFFETLLSVQQAGQTVLSHVKVLQPLLCLLGLINSLPADHEPSLGVQNCLLGLVHTLCVLLMEQAAFLDLFTVTNSDQPRFILFNLLTPYLHKPGQQGQQARDSLLLCISLSSRHSSLEKFIAQHSNFCPILASGLSGLFSALPRSLGADSPSWHKLDPGDGQDISSLADMLTSVELCSAVTELASDRVAAQLLELVHQGFLVPVLGPALVQETDKEAVVSSTAYLDLFLRKITAPCLLATVVRFLMVETVDGVNILDTLVGRISSASSQTAVVTLALFETLVSLNMEDVMLCLVFRHLLPANFLLPSFRQHLHLPDPHGRAAYKLLSLVPVSCDPPATPLTPRRMSVSPRQQQASQTSPSVPSQSYTSYLADARSVIRTTHQDCLRWQHKYDGSDLLEAIHSSLSVKEVVKEKLSVELARDPLEEMMEFGASSLGGHSSLGGESSGYLSGSWGEGEAGEEAEVVQEVVLTPEEEKDFWSAVGYQDGGEGTRQKMSAVLARIQHEDRLSENSLGLESQDEAMSPRVTLEKAGKGDQGAGLGPFLTKLLERVASFSNNNLGVNLRLTALVSKLASFPQPLLKAVLLHPDVVVQPSCTTLIQAICTARLRIDSVMPGLLGSEDAVRQAKEDLVTRIQPPPRNSSTTSLMSLGDLSLRRSSSFLKMFSRPRPSPSSSPSSLSPIRGEVMSVPHHTRQMAMAAVLLEEWLQELAALAQEHSVLEQQETVNMVK